MICDHREVLTELLESAKRDKAMSEQGMQTSSVRESAFESGVHYASVTWVYRLERLLSGDLR